MKDESPSGRPQSNQEAACYCHSLNVAIASVACLAEPVRSLLEYAGFTTRQYTSITFFLLVPSSTKKAGQQEGSLQVGSSVVSLCPEPIFSSRVLASSYGVQPKTMATAHVVLRTFDQIIHREGSTSGTKIFV